MPVTTPAIDRQDKEKDDEGSCEDLGLTHMESDLDEGDPAVDIDAEPLDESGLSGNTTGSCGSNSSTDSEAEKAPRKKVVPKELPATCDTVPATGGTVPATGGKPDTPAKFGKSGPTIFDNGYFFIKSNELDLKMFIHDRWAIDPPLGIGRLHNKSKTITPSKVGEARADPVRSM